MRREGGYTLLEMLVALAIVAMIGAALAQSTTLASRFWTASRTAEAETEADILRVRLRQWLTTAKPPSELSGVKAPMRGDERRFSFVTTSRLAILARDEEAEIEGIDFIEALEARASHKKTTNFSKNLLLVK